MRPRQFTDQQLLEVAREAFLEHGPSVSTTVIAERLGVSQAALFRRVGTKDELLRRALTSPIFPEWIGKVEAGPDERSVLEQLLELAREVDRFFARMVPAVSVLRASGMCPADIFAQFDEPPPIRGHRAVAQWFARLLQARRICECEPEAIAVQFLGGLISRHALRHTLGDRFPDGGPRYIESLAGTLWAALQPHSEASP